MLDALFITNGNKTHKYYIRPGKMINDKSISALKKAKWTSHFNRPLYDDYAYSCIPSTISKLLTGEGEKPLSADTVAGTYEKFDAAILFLIDGFGWEFFEGFRSKHPFLSRFEREGVASKISSQFPSTTAAHITSINTGLQVSETGIYEWFYYEPTVDRMIAPLLFSYAGDHESGTLLEDGYRAADIFSLRNGVSETEKKGGEEHRHAAGRDRPFSLFQDFTCRR